MPTNNINPSETAPTSPPISLPDLLRDHDISCPHCRHNLRNLTTTRCPECRNELSIDRLLRPAVRFDYAWLTAWAVVIISARENVGAWEGLLRSSTSLRDHYSFPGSPSFLWIVWAAYWLALSPAGIFLLIFRRRFSRVRPLIRWLIAATLAAPFLYYRCL